MKQVKDLELNTLYIFKNKDNDLIASIQSFDPLVVTEHTVRGGCRAELELSIEDLKEFKIYPLTKEEEMRRLG